MSIQKRPPPLLHALHLAMRAQVLHGGANDVMWLQRDFHLFIVNLYDTEKACQVNTLCRVAV